MAVVIVLKAMCLSWVLGSVGHHGLIARRRLPFISLRAAGAVNPMPSYTHAPGSHPINKWGGLSNTDRRKVGGGADQLGEFLFELAQLAPCRYIVNGLSIMEAKADMRAGRAEVSTSKTPSGKTMLTFASRDGSFKIKLDGDACTEVVLEDSEETGLGIAHVLDAKGRKHLTAVMLGEDAIVHFDILKGRWSSFVKLKA